MEVAVVLITIPGTKSLICELPPFVLVVLGTLCPTQDSRLTLPSLTPPLYVTAAQLSQQPPQPRQAPDHPPCATLDELVTPAKLCTQFSAFQEADLALLPPDLRGQSLHAISLAHCPERSRDFSESFSVTGTGFLVVVVAI